ncbi:hypothetical protein LCGC14_1730480 [marine sediment metagenome]|uniref:Uncharacterized protein n=1 Tax=marine sediment metagenome TaxID=412755 RepID=A0A0F9K9G9_9ZZZZ
MDVSDIGTIKTNVRAYVRPKNDCGITDFASCKLLPGIFTIVSIDLNDKEFCIDGHWFSMSDFKFRKPK